MRLVLILMLVPLFSFSQEEEYLAIGLPMGVQNCYMTTVNARYIGEHIWTYGFGAGVSYPSAFYQGGSPFTSYEFGILNRMGGVIQVLGGVRLRKTYAKFQPFFNLRVDYNASYGDFSSDCVDCTDYVETENVYFQKVTVSGNFSFKFDMKSPLFLEPYIGYGVAFHTEFNFYENATFPNDPQNMSSGNRSFAVPFVFQFGLVVGLRK